MRVEALYAATFTTPEAWSVERPGAGGERQSFLIAEGRCSGRIAGRVRAASLRVDRARRAVRQSRSVLGRARAGPSQRGGGRPAARRRAHPPTVDGAAARPPPGPPPAVPAGPTAEARPERGGRRHLTPPELVAVADAGRDARGPHSWVHGRGVALQRESAGRARRTQ